MNYRHHFHAGNFADVMKHAILLALIEAMRAKGAVRVVETHAGAGLYDLHGEAASRSSEAEGGVGRLMTADHLPAPLEALRQVVRRENQDGALRFYPGSPLLALGAAGKGGSYRGFELRPDDFDSLKTLVARRSGAAAQVTMADGYASLASALKGDELVLIDPPFEQADDYDRAAEATAQALAKGAAVAIWAPIKDLETLDALVRRIELLSPNALWLAEVRLRPLSNPMKMNGCAMLLVNTPDVGAAAEAVCAWVANACGEAGARGEVQAI